MTLSDYKRILRILKSCRKIITSEIPSMLLLYRKSAFKIVLEKSFFTNLLVKIIFYSKTGFVLKVIPAFDTL